MTQVGPSFEELVELFLARRRAGEPLDARTFAAGFPEHLPGLTDALESAVALECSLVEIADGPDYATAERVGSFRILREIGRGGMGVVLDAIEEPLERRVALKLLPHELLASTEARARFQREAALAGRLDHPGICTVFGVGVSAGQPWIAMRFVEGESFARLIARARERGERCVALPGAPALDRTLAIARCIARVARALGAAHAQGVVHRDVKPSNLMVTAEGEPVLLDFGLAVGADSDAVSLTRTGETAGTPAYLAPELIAGERARPDAQTDVYALGVTLYECLTLERPFHGPTRDALYRAVLAGAPPDVRCAHPAIARDLAVVVATALEGDRGRRYASAALFAADLEAAAAGRPIAARPVGRLGRIVRWMRREPRQALLAGALTAAALALSLTGGILIASQSEVEAGRLAQRGQAIEDALIEGFSELANRRFESAEVVLARVEALAPGHPEARVGRAFALVRSGREAAALELLSDAPHTPAFEGLRALAGHVEPPTVDQAWETRASSFELFIQAMLATETAASRPVSEQGHWHARALELLDEAVVRAPRARPLFHIWRAQVAGDAGDEAAARSAASALTLLWSDSARALSNAGRALSAFDPREARILFERSVAIDPHSAPAFQILGVVHMRLGEPELAEAQFRRAIEIDSLDAPAFNGLGCALIEQGCLDDAREALQLALSIEPRYIQAWGNLARIAIEREDARAAAQALRHVLELDPGQNDYRKHYVWALLAQNAVDSAREQQEIVLACEPHSAQNWARYARLMLIQGRADEALEALEIARSLDPRWPELPELEAEAEGMVARDN